MQEHEGIYLGPLCNYYTGDTELITCCIDDNPRHPVTAKTGGFS
jgi:hypothetical protein